RSTPGRPPPRPRHRWRRRWRPAPRWSPPGEPGVPLLAEGGEALAEVLRPARQLQRQRLVAELLVEVRGPAGVQEPLREAEGDGGTRRQPVDELLGGSVELGVRHRGVDQSPFGGLLAGELGAEEDEP